jgi:hypothetical protein
VGIIFNYVKKKSNYSCVKFLLSVLWFIKRFVNAREAKLIDLRVKGEELKAKYQKALAELYFVAGTTL